MFDNLMKLLTFFFFGLAVVLIKKDVDLVGVDYLIQTICSTSAFTIFTALVFVFINYLVLYEYDLLSFKYIQKSVPKMRVFSTALIGFGISNSAGHAYASGGSIRYLLYKPFNVSKKDILLFISFESFSILLGLVVSFLLACFLSLFLPKLSFFDYAPFLYASSLVVLGLLFVYVYKCVLHTKGLKIFSLKISVPNGKLTFQQCLIGFLDNLTLFFVFYCLLNSFFHIDIVTAFVCFIIALTLALVSQVPGGVGVFESFVLLLIPHANSDKNGILAALVLFRVIYYFLPFLIASFCSILLHFKHR